jgi:preprotein translocase subunit SecB
MPKVKQTPEMYQFSLTDSRLLAANFTINQQVNPQEEIAIDSRITIDHAWQESNSSINLALTVNVSGDNAPFSLDVTMGGIFKFKTALSEKDQIDHVAEINCASILFPFLREVVADLTRRAGFTPLLLPPVNFVDIYHKNHSQK